MKCTFVASFPYSLPKHFLKPPSLELQNPRDTGIPACPKGHFQLSTDQPTIPRGLPRSESFSTNPQMALGPTLQQPRVELMLFSPLVSSIHPTAVALWAQAVSCHCMCHSGDLPHILEGCVMQLDSSRRLGTMWEHRQEHSRPNVPLEGLFWFFNFFPQISPPSQRGRQTQCLLAAGKSLTHFLQLQSRGQSLSDMAGTAWSILTPLQRRLLNKKQPHETWTLQEPNWGWDIAAQENNLFPGR